MIAENELRIHKAETKRFKITVLNEEDDSAFDLTGFKFNFDAKSPDGTSAITIEVDPIPDPTLGIISFTINSEKSDVTVKKYDGIGVVVNTDNPVVRKVVYDAKFAVLKA